MVDLVHLMPAKHAGRVRRVGLAARSAGRAGGRGVYLMPVLASFTLTHQWAREVRRWHPGPVVAVDVQVGDEEPVWVGHYGEHPVAVTAAEAAGMIRSKRDPRGFEVFLPRAVGVWEIRRIPQQVGWRYAPDLHGRRPCACPVCLAPGTYGAAVVRRGFPLDPPRRTKPELMAALRAAVSAQDIMDALWDLSGRRRGTGLSGRASRPAGPRHPGRGPAGLPRACRPGPAAPPGRGQLGGRAGVRVMSGRDDRRPAPEQVPDPQRDGAVVGSGGVWVVWRQDDHGNRYEVARHDNRAAAQRQADELEARGHKQIYWVARGA